MTGAWSRKGFVRIETDYHDEQLRIERPARLALNLNLDPDILMVFWQSFGDDFYCTCVAGIVQEPLRGSFQGICVHTGCTLLDLCEEPAKASHLPPCQIVCHKSVGDAYDVPSAIEAWSVRHIFQTQSKSYSQQFVPRKVVCMFQIKPTSHKVLLVDDDDAVREMMSLTLAQKGFNVIPAANVPDALKLIATELFDVLITDLHMPNASDGFAVVAAMRQTQPEVLTLIVSGYPDIQGAMDAVVLQADDILVKPFDVSRLAELVRQKMENRTPAARTPKERVASILERCVDGIVEDWLGRVKKNKELNTITLTDMERTGYLPKLIEDLIVRLRDPKGQGSETDSLCSSAAVAHGRMRKLQGYTPGMLVHDSRILQVTLFGTLEKNLSALDFSKLLPDVMTIADEVDSQLTQAMDSYMAVARQPAA